MKDRVYLIVTRHGVDRMLKTESFQLKAGERAFPVDIEVEDSIFKPPMMPTIRLFIPSDAMASEVHGEASWAPEITPKP